MKIFYKVGLIFLIGLCLVIGTLFLLGNALEDRLVNYSIGLVNEELPSPLQVKTAKFSFIRSFPYASVTLKGVNLKDKKSSKEILALAEIRLTFNLLKVLKNEYTLNSLVLKNGRLNFDVGAQGESFWNSLQSSENSSQPNFLLNFKEIYVENVNVKYTNFENGWFFSADVKSSTISGKIKNTTYFFNVLLQGTAVKISQNDFIYLANSPIDLRFRINVDDERYAVEGGRVKIEDSMLGLTLDYGRKADSSISMSIRGKNIKTETLLNFIAQKEVVLPKGTTTSGSINFNISIEGTRGSSSPFAVNSTFSAQQLALRLDGFTPFAVTNLSGRFSNGNERNSNTTEVQLKFDEVKTAKSTISGVFRMRNPRVPKFYFNGKTNIELSDFAPLLTNFPIKTGNAKGEVELLGTAFPSDSLSLSNLKGIGKLTLSSLTGSFYNHQINFSNVSGDMQLMGNKVNVSNATGFINGSSFAGNVALPNASNYLFEGEKLVAYGNLNIDFFDTGWFFKENKNIEDQKKSDSDFSAGEIQGSVLVKNFKHHNFFGSDVSANVLVLPKQYLFKEIKGKACLGSFSGQIALEESSIENQKVFGVLHIVGADISNLFQAFDDFGQETLRSTNVSGKVSGDINFSAALENWTIQMQSLAADANVQINSGKLEGLTQLDEMSRFISLEELKSVGFKTLENNIRIENGIITIPKMEVSSSVLDFVCSGTHSFTNDYSYKVRLNLTDILFRKATKNKPENSSFGEIQSDGTGRTRLYLKINGNSNSQKVSYDGSAAREEFRFSLKKEKETLKQVINEEFNSIFKRKALADTLDIGLKNEGAKDGIKKKEDKQKNKFQIEWDDN
jgi:hypothetical protein